MNEIPPSFRDVFEKESIAHVGTTMPDSTPHVTPMWVDITEDDTLRVNTVRGRQKERNLRDSSRVGLSVCDPDNPYRHVALRGEVVEMPTDGADEHIDELARQYLGTDEYPNRDDEAGERVLVRIEPESVSTMHRPKPTPSGMVRYGIRRLLGS